MLVWCDIAAELKSCMGEDRLSVGAGTKCMKDKPRLRSRKYWLSCYGSSRSVGVGLQLAWLGCRMVKCRPPVFENYLWVQLVALIPGCYCCLLRARDLLEPGVLVLSGGCHTLGKGFEVPPPPWLSLYWFLVVYPL